MTPLTICLLASVLAGCAPESQTSLVPSSPSEVPAECVKSGQNLHDACIFLLGEADSRVGQPPSAEVLDKSGVPRDPEAIKSASAGSREAWLLKDEVLSDPLVGRAVKQYGLPDAVELESSDVFAMYHRYPARTFIFDRGRLITLMDIPRSVRLLTLKEQVPSTPWPVTLAGESRDLLGVPQAPPPPQRK